MIKKYITILFLLLSQVLLTGCGPKFYKSPTQGDLVPVSLIGIELNKRSVLYTDELMVITLWDDNLSEKIGIVVLKHSAPKKQIKVPAGKPFKLLFSEVDARVGYRAECHGEYDISPKKGEKYIIKYDFEIDQENIIHGDCYIEVQKITSSSRKKLERINFEVIKSPSLWNKG